MKCMIKKIALIENHKLASFLRTVLFFVSIAYLLQVVSPLRINTDVYRLLSMAVSAHNGEGYLVNGHIDQFPIGYPFIIKLLLDTGLANSSTLVMLNLISLVIGTLVSWTLYKSQSRRPHAYLVILFPLSSWVMIKHVTLPLTDLIYLALSSLSIFFLCNFYMRGGFYKWYFFLSSVFFGYLSLMCRTTGLCIFPVIAIIGILHRDHRYLLKVNQIFLISLGVLTSLSIVVFGIVTKTYWFEAQFLNSGSYFQSFMITVQRVGLVTSLVTNAQYRIIEFGEIFWNIPVNKIMSLFPILFISGLIVWVVQLYGAWLIFRTSALLPLSVYFLLYSVMIFLWPSQSYESRFWLPLLPVMAILLITALQDLQDRWLILKSLFRAYAFVFFSLGVVAIIFSTRISMSGMEFSELYGNGHNQMTYRYALQNGKPVDMTEVDKDSVKILRVFEPMAALN